MELDICIHGDGIVGLTTALLLAEQELKVGLVKNTHRSKKQDIRSYALNKASRDLLLSLQAWPLSPEVTPVFAMEVREGNTLLAFKSPLNKLQEDAAVSWIVGAKALQNQLNLLSGEHNSIQFLDTEQPARLQVISEGRFSKTRTRFGITFTEKYYPQTAIATRISHQKPHGQIARQWFHTQDIIACLPTGGVGGKESVLIWSASHQHADDWLTVDPKIFCQYVEKRTDHLLGEVHLQSERQSWPLVFGQASHWVGQHHQQNFALVGDACHVIHPLAGQGLNLGLADAGCLAQVMRNRDYWRDIDDYKVLRKYERIRALPTQTIARFCDTIQALYAYPSPWLAHLRRAGMQAFSRQKWLVRQGIKFASGAF